MHYCTNYVTATHVATAVHLYLAECTRIAAVLLHYIAATFLRYFYSAIRCLGE
jgi:hypothetical protein